MTLRAIPVAVRIAVHGVIWACALAVCVQPAAAQGGYYVEAAGDYSPVTIGTTDQVWQTGRVSGGWFEDGRSGWTVALERQKRDQLVDWGAWTRGFRRSGNWTFSGGVGFGSEPAFSYRRSYEGELARTVAGTLVAHGGYRYLEFQSATVHLIQPAVTLYLRRGDLGARFFIVRNSTRATTTGTLLIQGTLAVNQRIRLGGGGAYGERIFDIASVASPNADAWVGFGYARFIASRTWEVDLGLGRAHEAPYFSQRTLTVGVRRTFPSHP